MTAPRSTLRQRRGGSARLPQAEVADLELFFAGKQQSAWCLLLAGYEDAQTEIVQRWRAWHLDHPGAIPPAVGAWLLEEKK